MGWVVGPVCGPRLRWRGASWLQLAGVRPGLASRGCAGVYTFRALFAWGGHWLWPGAWVVSAICKATALEEIPAPLVHLYC